MHLLGDGGVNALTGGSADDLLYGAPGESGGIDGGPGNDALEAGPSNGALAITPKARQPRFVSGGKRSTSSSIW